MEPKRIKSIDQESDIQKRIMRKLTLLGWFIKSTHGNDYQCGFPDTFAAHLRHGIRWIEVKRPDYQNFTEAQLRDFELMSNNGAGVWVLTGDDDWEINKLFKYNNWWSYLQVNKHHTKYRAKKIKEPKESKIPSRGPEWQIQMAGEEYLKSEGWFVKNTHGNIYQYGFPDQFATHKKYGQRWIEYKNPNGYHFTPAQIDLFPRMNAAGVGVWVVSDVAQLWDQILFKPGNWRSYL